MMITAPIRTIHAMSRITLMNKMAAMIAAMTANSACGMTGPFRDGT